MPQSQTASPSSGPTETPVKVCQLKGCDEPQLSHRLCDGHLLERRPAEWTRLHRIMGKPEARLFPEPLRPLTRKTSRGFEVIDFAEMIGEPLLPWQQWCAIHALELLPDGSYRFRIIVIAVARQNGKSHLARILTLWRMYMDGAKRITGIAQDVALARDQWNLAQDTIHASPELEEEWGRVRNVNGDEKFLAAGCWYGIKAANRRAGRGGSNDMVLIDELLEQHDWRAWAAVSKTTNARPNGLIVAMSNAGDEESVVFNQLRSVGLAGTDPTLCWLEYSGAENCELDDTDAIAQANPALGHLISMQAIASSRSTDPPAVYRAEVLCQGVDQLDGALDLSAWKTTADAQGTMDALKGRVAAAFDISPDGQHCTLLVGAKMDDGRIRVEVAGAWRSTDLARDEIGPLLDKIKPYATGWYPTGPGAEFAPILRPRKGSTEITGTKSAEVCMSFSGLVKAHRIVHPGDPLLDAQVRGAKKLSSADGWRFTRRGGVGHVDGVYAAAAVVDIVETTPAPQKSRVRFMTA